MLPFNTEFQTGESRITQVRLSVRLANSTLLSLTEEDVMLGGFIRDSSTTVDGKFTVGAAVTGKLTVIIDNSKQKFSFIRLQVIEMNKVSKHLLLNQMTALKLSFQIALVSCTQTSISSLLCMHIMYMSLCVPLLINFFFIINICYPFKYKNIPINTILNYINIILKKQEKT